MDVILPASTDGVTTVRMGRKRLHLDSKDMFFIQLLAEHRFLTTQQIAKFTHEETRLFDSSVRMANRRLKRLRSMKLIATRTGNVGGVRQGSEPNIWHLAKYGHDMLETMKRIETNVSKKPFKAPTYTFARHRMAINDTKLILKRIADTHDTVTLGEVLIEEKSWRYYTNRSGTAASLRPDMHAVTYRGDSKHHWFIEVDCNTEAPVRIIAKCNMYLDCAISTAQDDWCCGQFPAVLWVVPTIKRRDSIQRHIAENFPKLPVGQPFIVVTPQELPALIAEGKLGKLQEVDDYA